MTEDRVERRLAAILAADVVGYSRLMGRDETGTRARLNAALAEVIRPAIAAHRGRLFKTMGDGLLAEFASVVDAVDCAVEIQRAMRRRAEGVADPLVLRIGVNLGDVIVEGDDVHGDGVNVAARLEALAEPGGVCISRSARDQVRDKLAYRIDDMGEIEVKNIARPVRAFTVSHGPAEAGVPPAPPHPPAARRARPRGLLAAGALALVAAAAATLWHFEPWAARVEAASVAAMALPLPEEPSVAVLPFRVLSDGEGDRVFGEALTEDLTRGLARIPGLFVIARSSTERYAAEDAAPARVAEDLGVGHVVRASLRRSGDRVRVDAEMIDALTGRIVFSERYDRSADDLFELQDDLVRSLAFRLASDLDRMSEQPRFTASPEAYLLWARADHESWINTPDAYANATALARRALEIDPDFPRAQGVLAFMESQKGWFRVAPDPPAAIARGLAEARRLVEENPDDWYLQAVFAHATFNTRDYETAAAEWERAIEMEPAQPRMLTQASLPLIFLGRGAEAERRLRVAIRLNPFHDWLPDQLLGQALFILERYEEAAESLEAARRANPRFIGNRWWRAAVYGRLGETEKAEEAVTEIREIMPDATISGSFIKLSDEAAMDRYRAGLRAAGLPE
jgi:class 3 adenylate cyclase/TolB-like protein/Tfp pilus assembly protein PilF